jgi:hypothetical protein
MIIPVGRCACVATLLLTATVALASSVTIPIPVLCTGNYLTDTQLLAAAGRDIELGADCVENAPLVINANNTHFSGHGFKITPAPAQYWAGGKIAQAILAAPGVSYGTIDGGYFDWTGVGGGVHIIALPSGNQHWKITGTTCLGAGDCVATIGSSDVVSEHNTALGQVNAPFDHWGGSTNIKDDQRT